MPPELGCVAQLVKRGLGELLEQVAFVLEVLVERRPRRARFLAQPRDADLGVTEPLLEQPLNRRSEVLANGLAPGFAGGMGAGYRSDGLKTVDSESGLR